MPPAARWGGELVEDGDVGVAERIMEAAAFKHETLAHPWESQATGEVFHQLAATGQKEKLPLFCFVGEQEFSAELQPCLGCCLSLGRPARRLQDSPRQVHEYYIALVVEGVIDIE